MDNKLKQEIIKREDKYYFVSTIEVQSFFDDYNYETMIFTCDKEGEVEDWQDLYCEKYKTIEEANNGHQEIIENFDNLDLNKKEEEF